LAVVVEDNQKKKKKKEREWCKVVGVLARYRSCSKRAKVRNDFAVRNESKAIHGCFVLKAEQMVQKRRNSGRSKRKEFKNIVTRDLEAEVHGERKMEPSQKEMAK
jgi:hypothetical protein